MEELLAHYDAKIAEMERNGEFVHPHFREARDTIAAECARVAALEAKLAEYRDELVSSWAISFAAESVNKGDGWQCPYMSDGEYAAVKLLDAGLVEKHPTEDWYRWKKKGGG